MVVSAIVVFFTSGLIMGLFLGWLTKSSLKERAKKAKEEFNRTGFEP